MDLRDCLLVTSDLRGSVRLWDLRAQRCLAEQQLSLQKGLGANQVQFEQSGKRIISFGADGHIRRLDYN